MGALWESILACSPVFKTSRTDLRPHGLLKLEDFNLISLNHGIDGTMNAQDRFVEENLDVSPPEDVAGREERHLDEKWSDALMQYKYANVERSSVMSDA